MTPSPPAGQSEHPDPFTVAWIAISGIVLRETDLPKRADKKRRKTHDLFALNTCFFRVCSVGHLQSAGFDLSQLHLNSPFLFFPFSLHTLHSYYRKYYLSYNQQTQIPFYTPHASLPVSCIASPATSIRPIAAYNLSTCPPVHICPVHSSLSVSSSSIHRLEPLDSGSPMQLS